MCIIYKLNELKDDETVDNQYSECRYKLVYTALLMMEYFVDTLSEFVILQQLIKYSLLGNKESQLTCFLQTFERRKSAKSYNDLTEEWISVVLANMQAEQLDTKDSRESRLSEVDIPDDDS